MSFGEEIKMISLTDYFKKYKEQLKSKCGIHPVIIDVKNVNNEDYILIKTELKGNNKGTNTNSTDLVLINDINDVLIPDNKPHRFVLYRTNHGLLSWILTTETSVNSIYTRYYSRNKSLYTCKMINWYLYPYNVNTVSSNKISLNKPDENIINIRNLKLNVSFIEKYKNFRFVVPNDITNVGGLSDYFTDKTKITSYENLLTMDKIMFDFVTQ